MSFAIEDALIVARAMRPYYGAALSALRPKESLGVPTIGVSRTWQLIYNPDWVQAKGLHTVARVIADHELQHLLRRHASRAERLGADPTLWNIAADAEINDDCGELKALTREIGGILPETLGMPEGLLAEEYYPSAQSAQSSPQCGSGSGGEALKDEDDGGPSEAEAETIRAQVTKAVRDAMVSGRGDVPAGVKVWADMEAAKTRKKDWRRELVGGIRATIRTAERGRTDYTWARVSRRSRPGAPIRPGMIAYRPNVHVVVDTSGSVSGNRAELSLAVLDQIKNSVANATWWTCDSEAKKTKFGNWVGGGGTDMTVAYRAAVKDGADVVVIVTDGDTPWPRIEREVEFFAVILAAPVPDGVPGISIEAEK
jgi:predicted metal-dependent peptidase